MTVSMSARYRAPERPAHALAVGQFVKMNGLLGRSETYLITGTMPARNNSPQYRIRNDGERYERVATEDVLVLVEPSAASHEGLIARTFGHG